MRKLIALIAVIGFAGQAQADNHMTHGGSYRLIYTNNANADFNENAGADAHVKTWTQRTKLNTGFKAGDNLSAQFNLVHNAQWGQNGLQGQYPNDITGTENLLLVNEAYVNWMMNDQWSVRFGRGSFTVADGTVVSANEWEAQSKAFEGALFSYDHEMAKIGVFGVQGLSGSPADNESGEFWGVNVDFKSLPEALKMVNFHYIMVKSNETSLAALTQDHARLGVTAKGDMAGVDYRATYAMLTGDQGTNLDTEVDASMIDAEVGYSMPAVRNLRVSLAYHTDSGDDEASATKDNTYQPFHYDRHNNAGLMDVVGWGNLTYQRLGLTMDATDSVKVGLEYLTYTATEKDDNNVGNDGTTSIRTAGADDAIGSEMNVQVTKTYSSNFSINARYGMFTPDDGLAADGDDNTLMYLEGMLTF